MRWACLLVGIAMARGPAFAALTADECQLIFGDAAPRFESVAPPASLTVPPGTKVERLGAGIQGGTVYRVEYPDGRVVAFKEYYAHSPQRKHDLIRLQMLEENVSDDGFRVVKARAVGENSMELDYVEGKTLKDVLADPGMDAAAKARVNAEYERCLRDVQTRLEKTYGKVRPSGNGQQFLVMTREGSPRFLKLSPENVVLAKDGRLYIIDPY